MENTTITKLLNEADKKLQRAEKEYNRPLEDVVELSVCLSVKEALSNYLKAFLLYYNIQPDASGAPAELLNQCISVNEKFTEIDLSPVNCKNQNPENHGRYCLSHDKTQECFAVAKKAKEMVMDKINLSIQAQ